MKYVTALVMGAAAELAAAAAPHGAALPRNCGELRSASGRWTGYLRSGGPTAGVNDVLVCDRDHRCTAVYAARAGSALALAWRDETLVIASDPRARRPTAELNRLGSAPPPVRFVRTLPPGATRLTFDPRRCATPPAIVSTKPSG